MQGGPSVNYHYLMKHISYHLHTIVRQYIPDSGLTESYCARVSFSDVFGADEIFDIFSHIQDSFENASGTLYNLPSPVILSVNDRFVYTIIPAADRCFIVGPVRLSAPVSFRHTYSITAVSPQWTDSVPVCEFDSLTDDILLIYNLCHKEELSQEMLLMENCIDARTDEKLQESYSKLVFENREYGKIHNPYDQELREFSSIENGNLDQLKRSIDEDYTGEIGLLADQPLRNAKNRAIVVVTLASRAAMRGGVVPEAAYSLSDSYIQKIEKCRDIPEVFHLFYAAEYEYARMVKELNDQKEGILAKDKNPHISKCKDYIFSHLHGKLSVQDIADALGLNAGYLSELFHACEKITLSEYIRREKINLAKNLLIYSRYSYSEISTYLGFSSQSHLGKYFKASTGMTMRQYRSVYGVKEFDTE